jgi:hypothetical protein
LRHNSQFGRRLQTNFLCGLIRLFTTSPRTVSPSGIAVMGSFLIGSAGFEIPAREPGDPSSSAAL